MPAPAPIQLQTVALRAVLPELVLRPGMALAARVAERHGQHGILMLAGAPLVAELPAEIEAGQRLRLTVQESTPERVVLKLADQPPPAAAPPVSLPLPDGRSAHVRVAEREGRGGGARAGGASESVSLVYESPALGPIEFRLALEGGGVTARVSAALGPAYEMADGAGPALREAIALATGKGASVSVSPRRDPLDLYA